MECKHEEIVEKDLREELLSRTFSDADLEKAKKELLLKWDSLCEEHDPLDLLKEGK